MMKQLVAKNAYRLRKIAGLNQGDLAEKAGISRPAYAAIEKGESDPRSETLHKIAEALSVSVKELFNEMPELQSIRFRMNKVTEQKRKVREQGIIKVANWLANYNFLEKELNEKFDYKLSKMKSKDPVRLAKRVREELEIGENEPIRDITGVINKAGIKLYFIDLSSDDFFGLSIGEKDGGPAICVNAAPNISIERQIFTSAHEMAHLLMHKESFKEDQLADDKNEEKEANIFASYFLMPQKAFKKEIKKYSDLQPVDMVLTVKRIFKVSYRTILMRLKDEGFAGDEVYQKFAISYKRLYGGSLKGHFEPEALTTYDEYTAVQEPEGTAKPGIVNARLYSLVRKAFEQEKISFNKAAEILEKSQDDMQMLVDSWKEMTWL